MRLNRRGAMWSPGAITRRTFLKAAGAAGLLATPFARLRGTALGQEGVFPTRLIVCYTANGVEREGDDLWSCRGTETDFTLSRRLSPLEPVKSKIVAFSGLDNVTHPGSELGHDPCIIAALTGRTKVSEPLHVAEGESIDQFVANRLSGARFRNLAVTVRGTAKPGFFDASGRALREIEQNPATAFARMFGDFVPPDPSDDLAALREKRRAVLDFAREETGALRGELCGQERDMLEAHLAALETARASIDELGTGAGSCVVPSIAGVDPGDMTQTPALAAAHVDLIAAAVACQLTPVVSFSLLGDYEGESHPYLGLPGYMHHDFAHGPAADQTGAYAAINDFFFGVFASLVRRLDSIPEGSGTVLDHSLVVYASDMRYAGHTQRDLPVVWAGSASGQVRTGRFLQFGGRNHADHLLSIARLMGLDAGSFGASTEPLPELS